MTTDSRQGITPSGGVRSAIFYFDTDKQPVDKEDASEALIVEYDSEGEEIQRTYMVKEES